jgi:SAM-dependent methyltransferase
MTGQYVLGTHDDELHRLGLQHQIWHDHTTSLWSAARFGPGQSLLDAGCGPGFATVDLAGLVGQDGRVTAVDGAQGYVDATRERVRCLGLANVSVERADLRSATFEPASFDGVFVRWVLSFITDPAPVMRSMAAALRPGGALLAMDYCHYRAARVFPASDTLDELFVYFGRANRDSGGDFDHGSRLAEWAEQSGLQVTHLAPIVHAARPGGRYWMWFTGFCRVFIPSLVQSGQMPADFAQRVQDELREREKTVGAFFMTPPIMTMIARKRA